MFHNPHLNRLIKPVLLVVILAVGAVTLIRAVKTNNPQTDFTVYTLAAQAVLDGGDIYQVQNVRGWNYVYPPLFAITMIPLAKIPLWMGVLAWYLVSVAAIYFSIRMCVEMAGGNGLAISLIPLLLLAGPSLVGLARGQASLLLLCLTTAGLYFEWNGRTLTGAACLAGAVMLKVFPIVLLGYFVWTRKWRFVVVTLTLILAGFFLLPAPDVWHC